MIDIHECIKDVSKHAQYYLLDSESNICGVSTEFKRVIAKAIVRDGNLYESVGRYLGIPVTILRTWVSLYKDGRLCESMREQLYHTYNKVITHVPKNEYNSKVRSTCIIYQNKYRYSIDQFRLYYDYIRSTPSIYQEFIEHDNDSNNIYTYITECISEYISNNLIVFSASAKYTPIQYMTIQDSIDIIQSRVSNLSMLNKKLQYSTRFTKFKVYRFDRIPVNLLDLLRIIMGASPEDHAYLPYIVKDIRPDFLQNHVDSGVLTREMILTIYKQIVCMDGYFYLVPPYVKHIIVQTNWDWEIANIDDSGLSVTNISEEIYKLGIHNSYDVPHFINSGMYKYITFKHSTYLNTDMYMSDILEDVSIRDNSETAEFKHHYSKLMEDAIKTTTSSVFDMAIE